MRSALITGATGGIGGGIARELATQGYGLTITGRRAGDLERLAAELIELGSPDVRGHAADLASRELLAPLVEGHGAAFGSMHALVLSGGVGTAGPFADLSARRVDKTFEVNVTSAVLLSQAALPLLRAGAAATSHPARVIAIASITGVFAEPNLAVYGASKAALISLMETLNAEESAAGVLATAIAPAFVDTEMSTWVADSVSPASMIPVADIVAVVRMLLSMGRTTSLTKIVLSRSGADPYHA